MDLTLTAVFEEGPPEEGGSYAAYVEELRGANRQGNTIEEARENVKDVIRELLAAHRDILGEELSGHKVRNICRDLGIPEPRQK